jgi:hypothetical protein
MNSRHSAAVGAVADKCPNKRPSGLSPKGLAHGAGCPAATLTSRCSARRTRRNAFCPDRRIVRYADAMSVNHLPPLPACEEPHCQQCSFDHVVLRRAGPTAQQQPRHLHLNHPKRRRRRPALAADVAAVLSHPFLQKLASRSSREPLCRTREFTLIVPADFQTG